MMAAQQTDVKMVKILLTNNANVNAKNQVIVFWRMYSYEFGPGEGVDYAFIQPDSQRSKPLTDGLWTPFISSTSRQRFCLQPR